MYFEGCRGCRSAANFTFRMGTWKNEMSQKYAASPLVGDTITIRAGEAPVIVGEAYEIPPHCGATIYRISKGDPRTPSKYRVQTIWKNRKEITCE